MTVTFGRDEVAGYGADVISIMRLSMREAFMVKSVDFSFLDHNFRPRFFLSAVFLIFSSCLNLSPTKSHSVSLKLSSSSGAQFFH